MIIYDGHIYIYIYVTMMIIDFIILFGIVFFGLLLFLGLEPPLKFGRTTGAVEEAEEEVSSVEEAIDAEFDISTIVDIAMEGQGINRQAQGTYIKYAQTPDPLP